MTQEVYDLIFQEDDVKWQSIIYELVRTGRVNPWDIDVSKLSKEYIKMIKKLKKLNFRLSGKVVFAASVLLRLKTHRLGLDEFLNLTAEDEEEFAYQEGVLDFLDSPDGLAMAQLTEGIKSKKKGPEGIQVKAKLPGPRTRKVSVFELMSALKTAVEVEDRRDARLAAYERPKVPSVVKAKKVDIFKRINEVHSRISKHSKKKKSKIVKFSEILPSTKKKDVIWTFIPLLHLSNQEKVLLEQAQHFGEIDIHIKELYGGAK